MVCASIDPQSSLLSDVIAKKERKMLEGNAASGPEYHI
jgi:hypothetical protein